MKLTKEQEMTRYRAVVYTGTFREAYTEWEEGKFRKDYRSLVRKAETLMSSEWFSPRYKNKKIVIEGELQDVAIRRCPVCNGELVVATGYDFDYNCLKCARGWRLKDGKWRDVQSTSEEVLTEIQMKEFQVHREVWTVKR